MSTIPEYAIYVTGADGSEAKITGEGKALASIEQALAYMGAGWNEEVETWDFGFYSDDRASTKRPLPIYKIAAAILEARSTGRVPLKLVDALAQAIVNADKNLKAARDENEEAA